jgi:hypothetical protein
VTTKTRRKYNVSPEAFVAAWTASETTAEVATRLSMPRSLVLARAWTYRKRGVKLKTLMRFNTRKLDLNRLNELAAASMQDDRSIDVGPMDDCPPILF